MRVRRFESGATRIMEMSDGVKAFVGLVSALVSSEYRVMIAAEREAFPYPPLS